ncbi:MAG TPA: rhomboid family intramembrane serine protease [Ginsengibacter sp.]|nr:rhomboid family intramembrane serine protease [Chitinophagaceae bacterium]HRN71941.1 rhomboid family intramembrane serine protease [Ginsengibacter sp.]HRP17424.1 rhomboid family intramembrane serine protease [Ginsengibacter sp.]HRP43849.1 rhomboid family intramembrane serine protease [Ginsengibacter sp.]
MGESERYISRRTRRITLGDDNNALMALVAINAMLFVCFGIIKTIYNLTGSGAELFQQEIMPWVVMPAKLESLAVAPWTVLTYMFVHTGVIITIVNLIWLWAFGSILQTMSGNKVIIPLYLYGGIAGAIFFLGGSYLFPALRAQVGQLYLSGATASVVGVAVATTYLVPRYRLFPMISGGIPLWVVTAVFLLITFVSTSANPGNVVAYSGAGLCGYFFMYFYKRGRDWGLWMNEVYQWFIQLFEPGKKAGRESVREAVFYKTGNRKPYIKQPVVTQDKIDSILDKINQYGYDSLTDEEKSILKKASEEEF